MTTKRPRIYAAAFLFALLVAAMVPPMAGATVDTNTKSYGKLSAKLSITYYSANCGGVTGYKITVSSISYARGSGGTETVLSRSGKVGQVGAGCSGGFVQRSKSFPTGAISKFPASAQVQGWTTYVVPGFEGSSMPNGAWHNSKISRGGGGYTYLCNVVDLPYSDTPYCGTPFTG